MWTKKGKEKTEEQQNKEKDKKEGNKRNTDRKARVKDIGIRDSKTK